MFLGTPRPHKGVGDLLAAFKIIDNPDLNLAIIGADNHQEFLERIDRSIRHRVVVLPKMPFDKLPELLSAADIIAIPQRRTSDSVGQIPARLFDAMSMAKPIIATRVSDIPEVLDGCGYLVDPNQPAQLAEAIEYILNHKQLRHYQLLLSSRASDRIFTAIMMLDFYVYTLLIVGFSY